MPDHPSSIELDRYARRRLPWREVLRVDSHLQSCRECSVKLAAGGPGSANARSLLEVVGAAGSHLTYSQLEPLLRVAPGTGKSELWRHLEHCASCRRELADLKAFARDFSQPTAQSAARPQPQQLALRERLGSWLGSPMRLAVTGVAAAVAVVLLSPQPEPVAPSRAQRGMAAEMAMPTAVALDDCAFDALAGLAPGLQAHYQAHQYSALARSLQTFAQSGEPVAQSALGVMAARGWGTARDLAAARAWLQRSAAQGDVCARRNLTALDDHG